MGHYIIKYRREGSDYWGVRDGDQVAPLAMQPPNLRSLILQRDEFLHPANLDGTRTNLSEVEVCAPVSRPLRVVCQGVNYASHREESALSASSRGNVMFAKDESAVNGALSPVMRPKDCLCLDYEVELGLVVGRDIHQPTTVTTENLHAYVAGILLANDLSPRDLQYKDDYAQWYKAKSCRTLLPLGPVLYLMDKSDFDALANLQLRLWVNGDLRQNANTSGMIFKPAETLSEISSFMDLNAGDLVLTGTPGGVVVKAPGKFLQGLATWLLSNEKKVEALRRNKAAYLQDGDIITAHIGSPDGKINLGTQRNVIVPFREY